MDMELLPNEGRWRERFPATVEALATANGAYARQSALDQLRNLPSLLPEEERLQVVFQALRRDNETANVLAILTDRRYLLMDERTGSWMDDAPSSEVDVLEVSPDTRHGFRMVLGLRSEERTLKQLLPQREAERFDLLLSENEYPQEATTLMGDAPSVPLDPPIACIWALTLYPDRLLDHEGRHLPLGGDVEATVDTAGNIAVTRGRNLAAKGLGAVATTGAGLGPLGLLLFGNARHRQVDNRELYLLVEGPNWAYANAFNPDLAQT
jgi:hypothetical protein